MEKKNVLQKAKDALWCNYEAQQYYVLVLHFSNEEFISDADFEEAEKGEDKFYQRVLALNMVLSARQRKETEDDARDHAVKRFSSKYNLSEDYIYIHW